MRRMAERTEAAICGSVAVQTCEEGREEYRNRLYFVKPDGSVAFYDKRHLFGYGGEQLHYTAGQTRTVVEYGGIRWLLLVCYDLRFPVWARYGRAGEYDAIIVVANWPESRQQAWRVLTRARAIENQCYLIGANRVGDDQFCHYIGESLVVDSKGDALGECQPNTETALTVTLEFEKLDNIRQRFKVLNDRDM